MKKHFLLIACSFGLYASHAFAQSTASGQQAQTSTVNGATVAPGNEAPAPAANAQKGQASVSIGTAATADGSTAPTATTDREQPVIVDTKENAGADPKQ